MFWHIYFFYFCTCLFCNKFSYSFDFISIRKGSGNAVIVDDVLATGGTLEATNRVAGLAGYDVIDNVVLIDLKYVPRIDNFDLDVKSVVSYE